MRILIATPIFPPESRGPATYTFQLVSKLAGKKVSCEVVTFTQNPTPVPGVKIYSVPISGGTLVRQFRLLNLLLKLGKSTDLIYAQGADVVGLASVLAGKVLGKKVVVKFVGDLPVEMVRDAGKSQLSAEFVRWATKISLSLADSVIFPAKHLQQSVIQKYAIDKTKTVVIYNAVDD